MSRLLCITRGGEGGIRAQDKAIALAKDRDDLLVFLCVVDSTFLNRIAGGTIKRRAQDEMVKLGEFLLVIAVERAMSEGVQARAVVRSGVLGEVLPMVVREMEATTIVLESKGGETCIVQEENLDDFLESSK